MPEKTYLEGLLSETDAERLTRLEVEMKQVMANQEKFEAVCTDISTKLDSLLALKYEGAGAFWLASILMGTGIVSLLTNLAEYFRHG